MWVWCVYYTYCKRTEYLSYLMIDLSSISHVFKLFKQTDIFYTSSLLFPHSPQYLAGLAGSITKVRLDSETDKLDSRRLSCGLLCPPLSLSQLHNCLAELFGLFGLCLLAEQCNNITT